MTDNRKSDSNPVEANSGSDDDMRERLRAIAKMVAARASDFSDNSVTPSISRHNFERVRSVIGSHYIALEELNHVFQDINSTAALDYFNEHDASLIKEAASSLADARRTIRRLANREWVRKPQTK